MVSEHLGDPETFVNNLTLSLDARDLGCIQSDTISAVSHKQGLCTGYM